MYPSPQMRFEDKEGIALLEKDGIAGFASIREFLSFFVRHPFEYLTILGRHLINALHLPFNEVYIRDLTRPRILFEILNYTVLFLFFAFAIFKTKTDGIVKKLLKKENIVLFLSTLITCIAILPGAIELRFFMPAYVAVYVVGASMIQNDFVKFLRKHFAITVILYIIFYVLFSTIWGNTMASLADIPLQMIQ